MCGGQTRCGMAGATEELGERSREHGEASFPRHGCCDRPPCVRLRPSRRQLGRSSPSLVGRRGSSKSFSRSSEVVGNFGRSSDTVDGVW